MKCDTMCDKERLGMQKLFVMERTFIIFLSRIKPDILKFLNLWYVGLFICAGIGIYGGYTQASYYFVWYELAKKGGELALLIFSAILLPGMARRFRVKIPFVSVITFFRRQLGITMFLLAFWHYATVRLATQLMYGISLSRIPFFEVAGMTALFLTAPLFFTSNNWSVRILGPWWKRIHRLVYVIVWLLFLHVALQASGWGIVIGLVAVTELASLVYEWLVPVALTQNAAPTVPTPSTTETSTP